MTHTKGPWEWRTMGDLVLLGDHGIRPFILNVGRVSSGSTRRPILRMRDAERDLMVAATADHPDARLIAAAPDLLAACEAMKQLIDTESDNQRWASQIREHSHA